jgi:hypothetical protein
MGGLHLIENQAKSSRPEAANFAVTLNANEPYLNDHRPGGSALLGTVMGIELMVRAAFGLAAIPRRENWTIANLVVGEPLILTDGNANAFVSARREKDHQKSEIHCVVESHSNAGQVVRHFEAEVSFATSFPHTTPPPPPLKALDFAGIEPVLCDEVYELFFHGPAFRVVSKAWFNGDTMKCELNPHLPPLTGEALGYDSERDRLQASPQWIELGLQTAGLFEIATNARMMIPKQIGRIEFFCADQSHRPEKVFAITQKSLVTEVDRDDSGGMDMELHDSTGGLMLKISQYRTCPLPFPSDQRAIKKLARQFSYV